MLQTAELLKKVRKLEIVTTRLVDDVIGGAYHSVFKGRGIEFDEVREYTTEDDVRDIDWNVSARLNAPYVKKYVEERELSVVLLVDVSGSMSSGASGSKVCERAVEAAALLGLSAIGNQDRVGLMMFSNKVVNFLPPRGGRHNNLRLIRELVSASAGEFKGKTDIAAALGNLCRVLVKRSVIFVISDLFDNSPELEKMLKLANRRHDVIVLHIYEPEAFKLPRGVLNLYGAESGTFLRLSGTARQKTYSKNMLNTIADQQALCRRCGVEVIDRPCNENMVINLMNFFKHRRKRPRAAKA